MARILIADDRLKLAELLSEALVAAGHEVAIALDGNECLARLAEAPFALLIIDMLMPNKDGLTTIAEIVRTNGQLRIIAMSGGGRVRDLRFLDVARQLGAHAVLRKPFRLHELMATIERLLPADDAPRPATPPPGGRSATARQQRVASLRSPPLPGRAPQAPPDR